MPVNTTHREYAKALPCWQMMNDVCNGEQAVKDKRQLYLPMPNPNDTSSENKERYKQYLQRAVFLEVTKDTLDKYTGQAFATDPVLTVDDELNYLKYDADGNGVTIYQVAQQMFIAQMQYGRCGLLVEFSQSLPDLSQQDVEQFDLTAKIKLYDAFSIVNWQVSNNQLTMLVLKETVEKINDKDPFVSEQKEQYRHLFLDDNGKCAVQVWQEIDRKWQVVGDVLYPTDNKGNELNFIPFVVVGSDTNSWAVQSVPLESLARLNLAHYRNSADYEDSVFRCGQAQPVLTGVSNDRLRYFEEKGIFIGSATALMLEAGGNFQFVQASANSLASEAMEKKYTNMLHLGAKLVEPSSANKTATQASQDSSVQNSVASMCIVNLNEAMQRALQMIYRLYNKPFVNVLFKAKQEFSSPIADSGVLQTLSTLVQAGFAPKSVIYDYLRSHNLINAELSDDDIAGMIESDLPLGYIDDTKASNTT